MSLLLCIVRLSKSNSGPPRHTNRGGSGFPGHTNTHLSRCLAVRPERVYHKKASGRPDTSSVLASLCPCVSVSPSHLSL